MMKNRTLNLARLCVLLTVGLTLSSSSFAAYLFTELVPLSGGGSSRAYGINNSGQVVGTTAMGFTTGTLWSNGTASPLIYSSGGSSYSYDINDAGQVAGIGFTPYSYPSHKALIWNSGNPTILNSINQETVAYAINNIGQVAGNSIENSSSTATVWNDAYSASYIGNLDAKDINDAGHVVGTSSASNGYHAILWNGTTTILSALSGNSSWSSWALAINNHDQVVGYSNSTDGYSATLWNDTTAIDLGTLGHFSFAYGINNAGKIVGYSLTPSWESHAVLWDGSTIIDLNSLLDASTVSEGWTLVDAQDINDIGQIVGLAINSITGQQTAYLLTPSIPEPGTYALILLGLGILGLTERRKLQRALV